MLDWIEAKTPEKISRLLAQSSWIFQNIWVKTFINYCQSVINTYGDTVVVTVAVTFAVWVKEYTSAVVQLEVYTTSEHSTTHRVKMCHQYDSVSQLRHWPTITATAAQILWKTKS